MDTVVVVDSPCVAGGEDRGPEDNSSGLYHIHIRAYTVYGLVYTYYTHFYINASTLVLPRYKKICITILVGFQLFITIISQYIIIN